MAIYTASICWGCDLFDFIKWTEIKRLKGSLRVSLEEKGWSINVNGDCWILITEYI